MRARRTARSSTERVAAGAGLRLRLRLRGAGLRPGGLVGKEGALNTAGIGGGRGLVAFEKQNILYLNKFIREPEPVDCEGTVTQTYFPSSRAQSRSTWTRNQNLDRASLKDHVSKKDSKCCQREVVQKGWSLVFCQMGK